MWLDKHHLKYLGMATACLMTACHQTPADVANVTSDLGNGISNSATAAVAAVTPTDPGVVCADPGTQELLRRLIPSAFAQNARAGLPQSKTLGLLLVLSTPEGRAGSLPSYSFAETTVDNVDAATKKVSCTTSVIVEGSTADAHPRLSFAVQKALDASGDIVTLPSPIEIEAIAPSFIAGLSRQARPEERSEKPPVESQPTAPDQPQPATPADNVQ